MKLARRHRRTLEAIFARPTGGNIAWRDARALFVALGGELEEREGSRVGVLLFDEEEPRVFHRPHPGPHMDKRAVAEIRDWFARNRDWLKRNGVEI